MEEQTNKDIPKKFQPLTTKLNSQNAIAIVLSYYGHFLAVTKVLLNRLNKNSRDYTASQYE